MEQNREWFIKISKRLYWAYIAAVALVVLFIALVIVFTEQRLNVNFNLLIGIYFIYCIHGWLRYLSKGGSPFNKGTSKSLYIAAFIFLFQAVTGELFLIFVALFLATMGFIMDYGCNLQKDANSLQEDADRTL